MKRLSPQSVAAVECAAEVKVVQYWGLGTRGEFVFHGTSVPASAVRGTCILYCTTIINCETPRFEQKTFVDAVVLKDPVNDRFLWFGGTVLVGETLQPPTANIQ
jgi:hypothetical protein